MHKHGSLVKFVSVCVVAAVSTSYAQSDPLPSWNADVNKQTIDDFVDRVTKAGITAFVQVNERIATSR